MKTLTFVIAAAAVCLCQAQDELLSEAFCDDTDERNVDLDRYDTADSGSCDVMPGWQSTACAEDRIEELCADESDVSACRLSVSKNRCCNRLTRCEELASELDCSEYTDFASCPQNQACDDVFACFKTCRQTYSAGDERRACKQTCKQAYTGSNFNDDCKPYRSELGECKQCAGCDVATEFCVL